MKTLSEHTGGIHWGDGPWWLSHCATWPFSHLYICDDRLIVTMPEGAYEFPRASVVRLSRRESWLSRALRLGTGALQIEHAVPEYPSFVLFSTFDIRSLCERLSAAGFPVKT